MLVTLPLLIFVAVIKQGGHVRPEGICDHVVQTLHSLAGIAGLLEVCQGFSIQPPYLLWPKHPGQADHVGHMQRHNRTCMWRM